MESLFVIAHSDGVVLNGVDFFDFLTNCPGIERNRQGQSWFLYCCVEISHVWLA